MTKFVTGKFIKKGEVCANGIFKPYWIRVSEPALGKLP